MVKYIKEIVKWSMKVGLFLVVVFVVCFLSFWCNNMEDRFNLLDLGFFLCVNSEFVFVFWWFFSYNFESIKNWRFLLESDVFYSFEGNVDIEFISSGIVKERKISLKKKNKVVFFLGMENGLINLWILVCIVCLFCLFYRVLFF